MSVRIVSIVGARPQFVKLAPICRAMAAHNARGDGEPVEHLIVHTGQHYDPELSDVFFEELEIPRADVNLGVGSGPHGRQTGRMLEQFEDYLLEAKPDAVLVYGDTNSTIAGALVAAKQRVPVAHVEAGLRSFNRAMPEEINRIATDHVSDLLFAPTPTAMRLLDREGLGSRAHFTGDVGYDAVRFFGAQARRKSRILDRLALSAGRYVVVTLHRSENSSAEVLNGLLRALSGALGRSSEIVFPMHPRTAALLNDHLPELQEIPGLNIVKPLGFLDMLQLIGHASIVLTDSGGLQKEAFFLNTPCITLRKETEWIETVEAGGNVMVGTDARALVAALEQWQQQLVGGRPDFSDRVEPVFGGGSAATHILDLMLTHLHAGVRRQT